jgi:phage shock protein B
MAALLFMAALLVFVTIVAPLWIVAHYVTRWRTAKALSPEDEQSLAELARLADRLERRMAAIEAILDADHAPASRSERTIPKGETTR